MPKEKPKVNIGEVIRSYRNDRGLSQGDIERRTGLLRCYLSRVENGHTVPSLETLAKIAEAMEISLADFFPVPTLRKTAKPARFSANFPTKRFVSSRKSRNIQPVYRMTTNGSSWP